MKFLVKSLAATVFLALGLAACGGEMDALEEEDQAAAESLATDETVSGVRGHGNGYGNDHGNGNGHSNWGGGHRCVRGDEWRCQRNERGWYWENGCCEYRGHGGHGGGDHGGWNGDGDHGGWNGDDDHDGRCSRRNNRRCERNERGWYWDNGCCRRSDHGGHGGPGHGNGHGGYGH